MPGRQSPASGSDSHGLWCRTVETFAILVAANRPRNRKVFSWEKIRGLHTEKPRVREGRSGEERRLCEREAGRPLHPKIDFLLSPRRPLGGPEERLVLLLTGQFPGLLPDGVLVLDGVLRPRSIRQVRIRTCLRSLVVVSLGQCQ